MAMSGGVDSSVAAYLLKEQGYEVVGITLKLWDRNECNSLAKSCCSIDDVNDARSVCAKLDIPFYVLNFKGDFQQKVIDYFVNSYLEGKTPNPCIACNRYIKFDELLKKADSLGMDYIATGHYAKIEFNGERYVLRKGIDDTKDQTYVLYNLGQEQLKRILLPLGDYRKTQIREIAEKLELGVAKKPDSQEICFVEDNNYARFISEYSKKPVIEGNFIDKDGKILGKHKGITHYTIGQRKGLGISFDVPRFVVSKNIEDNTVVLGKQEELFSKSLLAEDLNFISVENITKKTRVKAKTRYSSKLADAEISPLEDGRLLVEFDEPQRAITPGQAVVFYDGDIVFGGGTIV